jgi:hypothetical protein
MDRTGGAAGRLAALLPPAPALLLALAAAGCASGRPLTEEELLSQGPVVNEARPGAAREALEGALTPEEADAAADRAEAALAAGDPGLALETARAALARVPPREEADRLRAIRTRAKKAVLRSAIARAEAEAPARAAEGSSLPVRVLLRNLSPVPLEAPAPAAGASPTTVLLRVTREARDIFGNARSESWEEMHPVPAGLAAPGSSLEVAISVDTARFAASRPAGFVVYTFGGAVLPSGLRVGETFIHDRLPLEEASTVAFPQRGWEEVAGDPAAHLERGLRDGNPVRVLVAAACLGPAERGAAGARLAKALRGDGLRPAVESSVRAALRWLGEDGEADAWSEEAWEARAAADLPPPPAGEGPR